MNENDKKPAPVSEPAASGEGLAVEGFRLACEAFRIGTDSRTPSVLMANIENTKRFAEHLFAVEREFFMVPGEPDDECPDEPPEDVCLLNSWGSTTEQYVEQFRKAIRRLTTTGRSPEPFAFRYVRESTEHCVSANEEGEDFAISRPMIDALTTLGLLEKVGRGLWAPTDAGKALAANPPPTTGQGDVERLDRCESGDPDCGPAVCEDDGGTLLCRKCYDGLDTETRTQRKARELGMEIVAPPTDAEDAR